MKKKVLLFITIIMLFMPFMRANAYCKVSCGNLYGIPAKIPELTRFAVTIVQIAVPVILVIVGSIDLIKGITAQKEDEIKKGQKILVKRLIVAAIIFFSIVIVKLLVSVVASSSEGGNIVECIDCFLSSSDSCKDNTCRTSISGATAY